MFRFNFGAKDGAEDGHGPQETYEDHRDEAKVGHCRHPCKFHYLEDLENCFEQNSSSPWLDFGEMVLSGRSPDKPGFTVKYADGAKVDRHVRSLGSSETGHEYSSSDLVPNVYEGGFKVWECTKDLAEFLLTDPRPDLAKKNVLDLGCGAGLLGILAAALGAGSVTFQDFNPQVIENLTYSNFAVNRCRIGSLPGGAGDPQQTVALFCSGPWEGLAEVLPAGKTDVILTSETIYCPENYKSLLGAIDHCLSPEGVVYLAAKVNYFGVGGSLRQFEQFLSAGDKWRSKVVAVHTDHIVREVLEIRRDRA